MGFLCNLFILIIFPLVRNAESVKFTLSMRLPILIIFVLLQCISFLRICHGTINFTTSPLTTTASITNIATTTNIPKSSSMKFMKTTISGNTITSSVIDLLDSNVICDHFSVSWDNSLSGLPASSYSFDIRKGALNLLHCGSFYSGAHAHEWICVRITKYKGEDAYIVIHPGFSLCENCIIQGVFLNDTTLFTITTSYRSGNSSYLNQILHFQYDIQGFIQFSGKTNGPLFNEQFQFHNENCLAKFNDTIAILMTQQMNLFLINVATNSTQKVPSQQEIDIGTIEACTAFQMRNKMMVIVAGAYMTSILDLSTKDGNWTIGLIPF